jgi:hypothetical protein
MSQNVANMSIAQSDKNVLNVLRLFDSLKLGSYLPTNWLFNEMGFDILILLFLSVAPMWIV